MNRNRLFWILLLLLWPVAFVYCWKSGTVQIGWNEFVKSFTVTESSQVTLILFQVRLPRMILAAITGASLALTGAIFQSLLRNALADPYILGISGGAALGATIAIIFRLNTTPRGWDLLPVFAFAGALMSIMIVYKFSRSRGVMSVHTMLLAGVSLQAMLGALVLFIYSLFDPYQLMEAFTWMMGRIPSLSYEKLLYIAIIFVTGLVIVLPKARDLNALVFGETDALSLGVETEKLRKLLFVASSLLTGSVVALTGLIGFVGILVPHVMRLLLGPDYRHLLPASVVGGSLFLFIADTLARTLISPHEIPVGVITALTGGPFFLYLLWKNKGVLA